MYLKCNLSLNPYLIAIRVPRHASIHRVKVEVALEHNPITRHLHAVQQHPVVELPTHPAAIDGYYRPTASGQLIEVATKQHRLVEEATYNFITLRNFTSTIH